MGSADTWFQLLQAVGALATAIGVAVAAVQLRTQKTQQRTDFEDRLTEQYRGIIADLPLEALLEDRDADEGVRRKALHTFYRYFDLTNEQIFLFNEGRISPATWGNWEQGIRDNMTRKAFREAWGVIATALPDSFDELRKLVPPPSKVDSPMATVTHAERPRPSAEVVMPHDAAGRVLAIRKATNSSWSNLRKAVASLSGEQHEPFGTINVENTSKSIVRRMLRETTLSIADLSRLLDELSGDGREAAVSGLTSHTNDVRPMRENP